MITLAVVAVISAAAGFGAGRIKNAAKLAAIKAEVAKIEGVAKADFEAIVTKIKSLL